jgi:hypothetical protein
MVRMVWKLRREGGGAKDEKEGRCAYYSFIFIMSICHQDHSSYRLHHGWNTGSEKHGHSVGVRSFFLYLPEMTTTAGNYELERKRV